MKNSEMAIFQQQGFGQTMGLGERPALILVDFVVGFDDPKMFGGGNIHDAVLQTVDLLKFFRKHRLPIAFTRYVYSEDGSDSRSPHRQNPLVENSYGRQPGRPCRSRIEASAGRARRPQAKRIGIFSDRLLELAGAP